MIEHSCSSFEGPGVGLVQGVVQLVNTRVIPWSGTIHPRWITSPTEKIHQEETSRALPPLVAPSLRILSTIICALLFLIFKNSFKSYKIR